MMLSMISTWGNLAKGLYQKLKYQVSILYNFTLCSSAHTAPEHICMMRLIHS